MDELIKRLRNRRICIQQSGSLDDFPLLKEAADAIEKLEAALILMVLQYCTDEDGTLWHQFMSAGEGAFDALGITLNTDPQVLWDRLEEIEAKEES